MKFEFLHVQTGAALRVEPNHPDAETEEVVFQENETGEVEAFADFPRYLVDHYGRQTSRYSPKRIFVSVEPVDKYEVSAAANKTVKE